MAMTKAERAALDKAEHEARLARALRFPTDPVPKPMTRDEIEAARTYETRASYSNHNEMVAVGWFYNTYSGRVTRGCSNGHTHNKDGFPANTQTAGRMFRTKAEAFRAMRHEKVREVAEVLAKIDKQIEDAELEPAPVEAMEDAS